MKLTEATKFHRKSGGRAGRQTSAQSETRISCYAELDEAARALFSKERRMKFAKATTFNRKSGQGLGIDPEDDLPAPACRGSAVGAAMHPYH
jgi:hypothetical protein